MTKLIGKCTIGTNANNIGVKNPIRYRGYYYDRETNLYYLNSRYYDPEVGCFISSDDIGVALSFGMGTSGALNLYAYCGNDPVNVTDSTGYFWDYVLDAVFLAWSICDVIKEPDDWKNWVALGVDVVFAVLPFVPSGAGQVIKVGNKVDNMLDLAGAMNKLDNIHDLSKITTVGESMYRVKGAANFLNASDNLYGGLKSWDRLMDAGKVTKAKAFAHADNAGWLFGKLRKGYTVFDIGWDIGRRSVSSYYRMERVILNIWKTRNIWKLPLNYYL